MNWESLLRKFLAMDFDATVHAVWDLHPIETGCWYITSSRSQNGSRGTPISYYRDDDSWDIWLSAQSIGDLENLSTDEIRWTNPSIHVDVLRMRWMSDLGIHDHGHVCTDLFRFRVQQLCSEQARNDAAFIILVAPKAKMFSRCAWNSNQTSAVDRGIKFPRAHDGLENSNLRIISTPHNLECFSKTVMVFCSPDSIYAESGEITAVLRQNACQECHITVKYTQMYVCL